MPGVVGIISQEPTEGCRRVVGAMVSSMVNEAFYDYGTYSVPEMGIYAGWVSHEGSFSAGQVFFNERRDIALLFSGECCIGSEASAKFGSSKRDSGGVSGVGLVNLYEKEGEKFLEKLNGLFSGLLIDKQQNRAFLFNDRYGLERIYWHQTKDAIYFASEAKALFRVCPELRSFDADGVARFLAFGCTFGERTLFRGVSLLPGATCWRFESHGRQKKTRYFSPGDWEKQEELSEKEYDAQLLEIFQRVLPRYSEHPENVGISLTGGLDTRMIMACLPRTTTKHPCYTFVGESGLTLDARLAEEIAIARDLEHHALRINPDFFQHFGTHLDRTVLVADGCAGATASHEIYFNAQARAISPVRLTGNFGSEVFRSVSTFKPLGLEPRFLDETCSAMVAAEARQVLHDAVHPVTFSAFYEIPSSLFGLLAAGRSQVTFRTPYLDNDLVALSYRAPAAMRSSSLSALRLIEKGNPKLACIPTDRGELLHSSGFRRVFRRAFAEITFKLDYLHKAGLSTSWNSLEPLLNSLAPLGIFGLHKFLPYRRWFRNELAPTILERLSSKRVREAPWWAKDAPELFARKHISGRGNYVGEINAILTLEAVERLFFSEFLFEAPVGRLENTQVAN